MTKENSEALRNIASDALFLRGELRRAAKRCHRLEIVKLVTPAMRERRDGLQDTFACLCSLAQQLSADVAAHLPATFKRLRLLDCPQSSIPRPSRRNDPDGIQSERWVAIEAELREIRADALSAHSIEPLVAKIESIETRSIAPKKRGRRSNPAADQKIAAEYAAGLEAGTWLTVSDFAKHKKRNRTTISKAIDRGRKA